MTAPVEACVVAYRNEDTIGALVESLRHISDVSLAVHDNGPGAATLEVAAQAASAAGIAFRGEACNRGNCGFGAGCNALAATSSATDLLFLNPDAAVVSWPRRLSADGRVVGALVRGPDGAPADIWGTSRRLRDEALLRWARRTPRRPVGTGYVSGAAMLIGRDTFSRLGGFDEGYFMYYEDIDLCARAVAAGVPVVLEPEWVVVHEGGHSVGRSVESLTRAFVTSYESGRRFHGKSGHARGYDALVLADSVARAVAFRAARARQADASANAAVARAAMRGLLGRER